MDTFAWWRMPCGRALGMFNGNLIEYDSSTLAPIGLVLDADELLGKKISVVNSSGLNAKSCQMFFDAKEGMEGAKCIDLARNLREQAIVLLDKEGGPMNIVHPKEDGSYYHKFDRNKIK